ncbi:multisubunit sodium/proton antiporter, MrpC subunit [Agrococcus baldri]|uniref:Multisubunit sodium/proton antiporter, MrpC subunit n=1 Tax=Agrococcus baldri TaxID=153730 RepID=A0AA94L094_9MICO|nr:Na(+)/H(+) antiporter subunit C [Agrococcus baldri]SFS15264.1 multisubunit sodium/proton antiporter, MrpC subunit [Agrococcus baldri]
MTPTLILAIAGGVLIAAGVYLLLERSLMRILAGVMLAGNGVNLLFLVSAGPAGDAAIVGADPETIADPLPQAMVLTAIVITLATSAFLLAMSYRSFQLEGHDEVADDVEDAIIRRRAEADLSSEAYVDTSSDSDSESGGRDDSESGGRIERETGSRAEDEDIR